jgi:hypothetical protein
MFSLKIPFGGEKHQKVVEALASRRKLADEGHGKIEDRLLEADKLYRAYSPDTEKVAAAKAERRAGEIEYVQINIPFSTATLLTAHTYWTSVFLSRSPIFQYMSLSEGPEDNVLAVEALINYQMARGRSLPLWGWLMDVGYYGRGILGHYWAEEVKTIARYEERPVEVEGVPIEKARPERAIVRETLPGYAGNRLFNVHPRDFRPDPRVSLSELQRGEFCGRIVRPSWNDIVIGEAEGRYFNVEELKKRTSRAFGGESIVSSVPGKEYPDLNLGSGVLPEGPGFIECHEYYVNLIPAQWGLSAGATTPEKWVFTWWNDELLIEARPFGHIHDRYPYEVLEYEVDPYSISSRGVLEMLDPLNYLMTWLVNVHFYNVRAILNGTFVADTARLMTPDFKKKGPGRIFRLNPSYSGTDVRTVLAQLPVADVTQQNIQDLRLLEDLCGRLIGASANTMGVVNPGGRKTATEIRSSTAGAAGRMKTNTEYFSAMGFAPLGGALLSNSQQFYRAEQKLLIAGDQWRNMEFIQVNPMMLAGEFDYVPVDGTMPIDRLAQATLWREMFQVAGSVPQIGQQYDIAGIFSWVAQLAGLRNINRFKVQVAPPMAPGMSMAGAGPELPTVGNRREVPLGVVGRNVGPAA